MTTPGATMLASLTCGGKKAGASIKTATMIAGTMLTTGTQTPPGAQAAMQITALLASLVATMSSGAMGATTHTGVHMTTEGAMGGPMTGPTALLEGNSSITPAATCMSVGVTAEGLGRSGAAAGTGTMGRGIGSGRRRRMEERGNGGRPLTGATAGVLLTWVSNGTGIQSSNGSSSRQIEVVDLLQLLLVLALPRFTVRAPQRAAPWCHLAQ